MSARRSRQYQVAKRARRHAREVCLLHVVGRCTCDIVGGAWLAGRKAALREVRDGVKVGSDDRKARRS